MRGGAENIFSIIYIAGGIISCFWGYRLFRVLLGVIGFVLGAYIAASLTAGFVGGLGIAAIVAGLAGGLLLGSLFVTMYLIGVFILGALGGWVFGLAITGAAGHGMHVLLFVLLAVIGGVLTIFFQKLIIISSTALAGAWYAVAGAFYILGNSYTPSQAIRDPGVLAGRTEGAGLVVLLCWLALGISGIIFQYRNRAGD